MTISYAVIPTFNERDNLRRLSQELLTLVPALRILIIDDSSPDGTGELADNLAYKNPANIEVIHRSCKQGLASAYCEGFTIALARGADLIVQMDADFSHPTNVVPTLLSSLQYCDLAIGSRYSQGGKFDSAFPLRRKALSWLGNQYIRLVLGLPIRDITSGFCAFRRELLLGVDFAGISSGGFVFQAELKANCHRRGARIREVPFVFMNRRAGQSKIGLGIILEAVWRVWLLKLRNAPRTCDTSPMGSGGVKNP